MKRKTLWAFLLSIPVVLSPLLVTGQESNPDTYRQLKLFGDVFERVRADYVEEVADKVLVEAAIQGMLNNLDPHSSYLDAVSYKEMQVQTRGEFGGLGIEVTMENGYVKVVSPIDDTPAHRAGVMAGDIITHLDGESVQGLTLAQAVERMRGPVSTAIRLTIRREGRAPLEVSITRDVIHIQATRARTQSEVGYVRITQFNEQTNSGLEKSIKQIETELGGKLKGFVIDLRNNPGGLLDQAIAVSDAFLDKGAIVSTRGRRTDDANIYNAKPGDLAKGLPIVVLINGGSASASEIVAGALQDHRRAIIMGTRSFGKGSVQTIIPLASEGAIRLTTSRYYTPSGHSIQAKGIEPDIVVEQARIETAQSEERRREKDLRGALDAGREVAPPEEPAKPEQEGQAAPPRPDDPAQDFQLARAIDLIRGIALYGSRS